MSTAVAKKNEAAPAVAMTPMDMLQIAVEKGADLNQLQKLMDLQERWEAGQAKQAFNDAIAAFKANPPTITKNKEIKHNNKVISKYADLAQVCKEVIAGLNENGITHRWETNQSPEGIVMVTCILTHRLGHSETNTMQAKPDESGAKNSIQAIASTNTYLQRYTLLGVCGLAVEGQDDDGQSAAPMKVPAPKGVSDEFENNDGTLSRTGLGNAVRELGKDVDACSDGDELTALLNMPKSQEIISLTQKFLPSWWNGDGGDLIGLGGVIRNAQERLGAEQ